MKWLLLAGLIAASVLDIPTNALLVPRRDHSLHRAPRHSVKHGHLKPRQGPLIIPEAEGAVDVLSAVLMLGGGITPSSGGGAQNQTDSSSSDSDSQTVTDSPEMVSEPYIGSTEHHSHHHSDPEDGGEGQPETLNLGPMSDSEDVTNMSNGSQASGSKRKRKKKGKISSGAVAGSSTVGATPDILALLD